MRSDLIPTIITDKNGKTTKVYRKASQQNSATAIPTVNGHTTEPSLNKQPVKKQNGIIEYFQSRKRLKALVKEKRGIISRLANFYESHGMDGRADSLKERIGEQYVESLRSMESLVAREPADLQFAIEVHNRYDTSMGEMFYRWTQLAERHYDSVLASPLVTEDTSSIAHVFSACLSRSDTYAGYLSEKYNPQQERNFIFLTMAALDSNLEGHRVWEKNEYGRIHYVFNGDLIDYANANTDDAQLLRLCQIIQNSSVTSFNQALLIDEEGINPVLADGAL